LIRFEKNEIKLEKRSPKKSDGESIRESYTSFVQKNSSDETEFLFLPLKIVQKLGESIEHGWYFSKNIYIRKEVW